MSRRPRVLVWQWGRFGAGPRLALELAGALRAHEGLDVWLSLAEGAELLASPDNRAAVTHPVATYDGLGALALGTLAIGRRLAPLTDAIAKAPPDAAIAVMPGLWDPFLCRALARTGVPIVGVIHDAANHPGDRFEIIQLVQRATIRRSAAIVTLSEHVTGLLANQGLMAHIERRETIPHPALDFADLALAPPTPPRAQGRPLRLLVTGRLSRYKGVPLLLDALRGLPSGGYELRIAGRLRDGRARRRVDAMAGIDLKDGWLSERELLSHIDWADAVVCPYVEASQSGIIPTACGRARAAIATPVGGLPEQVRHGRTGLIAEAASPEALRTVLAALIDDPARATALGGGALSLARGPLAWPAIAARYADLLASLPHHANLH